MMKYLKPLFVQFQALNTRERVLAIAAFLGVVYFLFDFALIRPQVAKSRDLRQKMVQQDVELASATQTLAMLATAVRTDPLAKQRAQRDEMRATFAEAEAVMARASSDIRVADVVRAMVAARPGLTLVGLRTLPVEVFFQPPVAAPAPAPAPAMATAAPGVLAMVAAPVAPAASAPKAAPAAPPLPMLYKHGVEVTIQGSYPGLVAYMQQLERNSGGVFWGNVKLDVVAYPESTLRLSVYTLSARPEQPLS